jgi:hypothetical protein
MLERVSDVERAVRMAGGAENKVDKGASLSLSVCLCRSARSCCGWWTDAPADLFARAVRATTGIVMSPSAVDLVFNVRGLCCVCGGC